VSAPRTILITGSTDGLGLALAKRLADEGETVLVHGRDPQKVDRVVGELDDAARGYVADFSSLDEVRRLAADVAADHEALDVLVNNAGIITAPERETSADGHEHAFAVNYLSHFLLTLELLDRLRATEGSRVVNVASLGQQAIDFDDVMIDRDWNPMRSYAQSKLAQIMFTVELAERLPRGGAPTVNALHPATFMNTKMVTGLGGQPRSSVEEGLEATHRLAAGDDVQEVTGKFFDGLEESAADPQAYDADARNRLWRLSEELTGADGPRGRVP
jgi:NAD(P)-dependent dehydrogenase (short-subunit alcohol dehydrogenase family)